MTLEALYISLWNALCDVRFPLKRADALRVRGVAAKLLAEIEADKDRAFNQGFAMAVGSLARDHNQPTTAGDIMRSHGISYNDLKKAGVEKFDLKALPKK